MLNKNKIIFVIINLILATTLHASNTTKTNSNDFADFELPKDTFNEIGGLVIQTKDTFNEIGGSVIQKIVAITKRVSDAPSKIKDFAVDHPRESAILAGVLIAGASLAVSEKLQRNREGLDVLKIYSRPGIAAIPVQHGLRPYFLGAMAGGATGVYVQRVALDPAATRVLKKTQKLGNQADLIKNQAQKNVDQAETIFQQSSDNACYATGLVEKSGQIIGKTGELRSEIASTHQKLNKFAEQSQAISAVQQTSFLASFYGLGKIYKGHAQIGNEITHYDENLDRVIAAGQRLQDGFGDARSKVEQTSVDIAKMSESTSNSRNLLEKIRSGVISCTGGSSDKN